jgi:heme oxygenase
MSVSSPALKVTATAPVLLPLLRAHTRTSHDRLETRLDVFGRMRDHDAYAALLLRFWGLYVPLEARLSAAADSGSLPVAWSPRRKTPLLVRDLDAFGIDSEARAAAPLCANVPILSDAARAVGCLYVVEGATLGGQVISREAAHGAFAPEVAGALAFFGGYGVCTGERWREFTQAAEAWAAGVNPAEHERAADAAVGTFAAFEAWLIGGTDA